jgi:hypothetical protein
MQTDFITRCRARHAAASAAIILTLLQTCAAEAIVAGRGAGAMGRHVVRLISRSSECSGTAIGRQEVLTSAHCMISSKPYYVIARGRRIAVAGYSDNGGTATLRLAQPLPASVVPIEVGSGAGDFIIAGYGVSHESARAQSAGLREARLVQNGSGSLVDPRRRGDISASACMGDSGGPVARFDGRRYVLVGIIERASHPSPTRACGDLTHFTAVGGSFFSSSFSDVKAAAAASPARRYVKAHRNKRVKVRPR